MRDFSRVALHHSIPPQFVAMEPAQNTSGIPTNTKPFSLTFDESVDPATSQNVTLSGSNGKIPGVISQSADGKSIQFNVSQPLTPGDHLSVIYGPLSDLAGNSGYCCEVKEFTVSSSASNVPLTLITSNPQANWKNVAINVNLQLLFSTPPDVTTLSGIQLSEGTTPIPLTATVGPNNPAVTLQTASPLDPDRTYTLSIAGVRGVAGNPLAKSLTIPFTTGSGADLTPLDRYLSTV